MPDELKSKQRTKNFFIRKGVMLLLDPLSVEGFFMFKSSHEFEGYKEISFPNPNLKGLKNFIIDI